MISSKPARNMYRLFTETKLIENSASCWFIIDGYITMHFQQNFIIHYLTAHEITSYFTHLCNMHATYINVILQSRLMFLTIRLDLDKK